MSCNKKNAEDYKLFKYYEGLCSSSDFPKEVAKVLALGVRSNGIYDIDGNELEAPFVLKDHNWDIVFPAPDTAYAGNVAEMTYQDYVAKIMNQVEKVSDTVILKTRTTEKALSREAVDELTVDDDSNKSYLEMYLEIYKPAYIANPEEYPLDCERHGIIPRLITKEHWIEKFKSHRSIEETLDDTFETSRRTIAVDKSILDNERIGTVSNLTHEECDKYVTAIQTICNDPTFGIPGSSTVSSYKEINASYLTKIKQEDASLYSFILNNLDGGIEAEEYVLMNRLVVECAMIPKDTESDPTMYQITLEGHTNLTTYTVHKNTVFTLKQSPTSEIIPELFLNGIYIPIEPELYTVSGNRITFRENFEYEKTHDGVLVVRYQYKSTTKSLITDRTTLMNNHYVLMRLFDRINEDGDGPAENVYNAEGNVIKTNSHASPWAKLSWYRDFEEIMLDHVDEDIATNTISDGVTFVPLETPGLNGDTKIRYWVNTNNDRFNLVVMGNPSLDYTRDRHVISACYCGAIDSFENSINDTAGNFALFTSSSTEPCNTTLSTDKVTVAMQDYVLSSTEATEGTYNKGELTSFLINIPDFARIDSNGTSEYYITLPENTYFDRSRWPKYIFIDNFTGLPITGLNQAFSREFVMEDGKSRLLKLTVQTADVQAMNAATLYVSFSYYTEKFIITSGVSRDVFGNVTNVAKENMYGQNTSDGVTSIMMYHTRSKAYYQKHHMLFATTEEYMSKIMYGKSQYTGEYYADRIKVTHGNDGPRGILSDMLVIDSSSLYPFDELVINKDFAKDSAELEETFVYFPVTAHYSPLSDGPNARYGIALKKSEREPSFTDELAAIKRAIVELQVLADNRWNPTKSDIFPPGVSTTGLMDIKDPETGQTIAAPCRIYWRLVENSQFTVEDDVEINTAPYGYVPVKLAVTNETAYRGDLEDQLSDENADGETVTISQGSQKPDSTLTKFYVKISGFSPDEGDIIAYGITDKPITSFGKDAYLDVTLEDGMNEPDSEFTYTIADVPGTEIRGVPLTGDLTSDGENLVEDLEEETEVLIEDAHPDKYLILYAYNYDEEKKQNVIKKFCTLPLNDMTESQPKNHLLQYPCDVTAIVEAGQGDIYVEEPGLQPDQYYANTVDYNSSIDLVFMPKALTDPAKKSVLDSIIIKKDDGSSQTVTAEEITDNYTNAGGTQYKKYTLSSITGNLEISVKFKIETVE